MTSRDQIRDKSPLGPVLIQLRGADRAHLEYVKGSVRLFDGKELIASDLPKSLLAGKTMLPYSVPGGTTFFVNWQMRVQGGR